MPYLNITENGSGRIHFSKTPLHIEGLSLKKLETCTGIVIIGDQGISVVHDESFLSIDSIKEEFNFVGTIKEWSIFCNPKFLDGQELANRQKEMLPLINIYKSYYIEGDEGSLFRFTDTGNLAVDRARAHICDVMVAIEELTIIEPQNASIRKAIRHVNNFCASSLKDPQDSKTRRPVPIDIQFNSRRQVNYSSLWLNPIEAKDIFARRHSLTLTDTESTDFNLYENLAFQERPVPSPIFPSDSREFDELEEIYEKDKDPRLLLDLIESAHYLAEKSARCSDHESLADAEEYRKKVGSYIQCGLESENDNIRSEVEEFAKEKGLITLSLSSF